MKIGIAASIHYRIRDMFKNRWRAFLSISGIFLALLLMMTGYFSMDSYYAARFKKYQHYLDYGIVQNHLSWASADSETIGKCLGLFNEQVGNSYLLFQKHIDAAMLTPIKYDSKMLKLSFQFYQTNQNFNGDLVLDGQTVRTTALLEGRGITKEDIDSKNPVVVIDSITNQLLYQGKGVGQMMHIPILEDVQQTDGSWVKRHAGYETLQIIGVYENSDADYTELYSAADASSEKEYGYYQSVCYMPTSCSFSEAPCSEVDLVYLQTKLTDAAYSTIKQSFSDDYCNYECYTYPSLASDLQSEMLSFKRVLNAATIILLLITVLLITQTMIFSIKENLSEYGIKKALGAGEERLAVDILLETAGYALIASAAAFLLAVLFTSIILNLLQNYVENLPYTLVIKSSSVMLSGLLSLLTICLADLLPILYMANKNIIEIIKFE